MYKQLTIFDSLDAVGDSDHLSPTNDLGDTKNQALQRYLNRAKIKRSAHTKKYKPDAKKYKPNGRKTEYYRLDYRHPVTRKPKSIHIPGGNIHARLAQTRFKKIQQLIDHGADLEELIAAVKTFNSGRK